jgi:DNA primase
MASIALGNSSARPDVEAHRLLESAPLILACHDYDEAGKHGADNLVKWYGSKVKRWPVPDGKDPGDYARQGGSIGQWIKAALS